MKGVGLILIVAVLFLSAAAAGLHVHVIISGSMAPAIKTGALTITADTSFDTVKKGDVIVYTRADDRLSVTHRVIRKYRDHLITRGDANEAEDAPVKASEIDEKVLFHVPLAGYLLTLALIKK